MKNFSLKKSLPENQEIARKPFLMKNRPAPIVVSHFDAVAEKILALFGSEPFLSVKNNPNFQVPYADIDSSVEQWLLDVLKTLFSPEELDTLSKNYQNYLDTQQEQFLQQVEEKNNQINQLTQEIQTLKTDKKVLQNKLKQSYSVSKLVSVFFQKTAQTAKLIEIIEQSIEESHDDIASFCLGLAKGWQTFQNALKVEEERLQAVHDALSEILNNVSGYYIPQRRQILKELARIANAAVTDYEFISPEETIKIDPKLHNASGVGGTEVKEGRSYAVIRASTKQTVIYAEIIANN